MTALPLTAPYLLDKPFKQVLPVAPNREEKALGNPGTIYLVVILPAAMLLALNANYTWDSANSIPSLLFPKPETKLGKENRTVPRTL